MKKAGTVWFLLFLCLFSNQTALIYPVSADLP